MTVEAHEPAERLKRLDEFTLADLESVRLVLRGDSVIDWHRLNLTADDEVEDLLRAQEFPPDEPADRARMAAIKNEAVSYLRRHFEYPKWRRRVLSPPLENEKKHAGVPP